MVENPGTVQKLDWGQGPLGFSQILGDEWYREPVRGRQ